MCIYIYTHVYDVDVDVEGLGLGDPHAYAWNKELRHVGVCVKVTAPLILGVDQEPRIPCG